MLHYHFSNKQDAYLHIRTPTILHGHSIANLNSLGLANCIRISERQRQSEREREIKTEINCKSPARERPQRETSERDRGGTFGPETQVHQQGRCVLQREVAQAVRVLELVHQPANQVVLDHGRLLAPPTGAVTVRHVKATPDPDGGDGATVPRVVCLGGEVCTVHTEIRP